MATAIANGDIFAIRAWTSVQEQAAVNTYNYEVNIVTGGTITDQDVVNTWDTLVASPFYQNLCASGVQYDGCQFYFLKHPLFLPNPVKSVTGAGPGTTGVDTLPRVACAILKYNTAARGPIGRGRVFLPFVSADYADVNGKPTTAFDVLVNSFASALLAPLTVTAGPATLTATWSLLHRIPASPPSALQILQAESAGKFAMLHKRGDYGRANSSPI